MRIEFFGHACFHIVLETNHSILIDPYEPNGLGGRLRYEPLPVSPSWVLVTHEHRDHADTSWAGEQAQVIGGSLMDPEVTVTAHTAAHDEHGGSLRGGTTRLFVIEAEGLRLLHCGDLGERLLPDLVAEMGPIDVAMIPVGGYYTIGPSAAAELVGIMKPKYVLPCHYQTDAARIPELADLGAFTRRFGRGFGQVVEAGSLDPSIEPPVTPTVVVLEAKGIGGAPPQAPAAPAPPAGER